MGAYAGLNALVTSLQLVVAGIFYFAGLDLAGLAILLLVAQVIAALLAGLLCMIRIPEFWAGWRFSSQDLMNLVYASAPLALLSGLMVVYQRLSPTLLPILAGVLAAGHFSASARVVEAAKVVHLAVFTALYPAMAQRKSQDPDWFNAYRGEWLVLLGIAVTASLVLFLLAGPLTAWFFGAEYSPSVPVLRILAWTLLPYTFSNFLNLAFLANGDETAVLRALLTSLLALATLTAWWGRAAGSQGAAWAVLYAESLQAAILLFQAARRLRGVSTVIEEA
jgi:O-antigen/teichoic acid export membrane protein